MICLLSVCDLKFDARVHMTCLSKNWPSLTKEISLWYIKRLALYIEHMINDIDLEVYKQVRSIKQILKAIKCYKTQVWYICLSVMLIKSLDYTWLMYLSKKSQVISVMSGHVTTTRDLKLCI